MQTKRLPEAAARAALATFDDWMPAHALQADTRGEDFIEATQLIRRFDFALRTPDALHIAAAETANLPAGRTLLGAGIHRRLD